METVRWIPFSRRHMQTSFSTLSVALHAIRLVRATYRYGPSDIDRGIGRSPSPNDWQFTRAQFPLFPAPDRAVGRPTPLRIGYTRPGFDMPDLAIVLPDVESWHRRFGWIAYSNVYPTIPPPLPITMDSAFKTSHAFFETQDIQDAPNYSMRRIELFTNFPPPEDSYHLASVPISGCLRARRLVAPAWGRMHHPYQTTTRRQPTHSYEAQGSSRGTDMDPPLVQDSVPSESTPRTFGGYNVQSSQSSSNAVAGPSRIRLEDLNSEYDGALQTRSTSAYSSLSWPSTSFSASLQATVSSITSHSTPDFGPYAQVNTADNIPEIAFNNGVTLPGFSSVSSWRTECFHGPPSSGPRPDLSSDDFMSDSFVEMPWLFDELEALADSVPCHFYDHELNPHPPVDSSDTVPTGTDTLTPLSDDALPWLSPTQFAKEHAKTFLCRLPRDSKRRGLLDAALGAISDECGAILHTPAAFDRHLTVDHEIPNAKDVKHSARCAWPKCKSQKVMEVGSYHRHVLEKHAMHWRCPFVGCPQRQRETVDKKTGEKVMSYPRHTNLGMHIRDDHDPGDLLRIKALYGQGWKFAFACFHGQ